MEKKKNMFAESASQLKKINVLTLCAMFAALALVLESFAIPVGPYIKIGFSGIPNQIVDVLFGPITGLLFGGIMDIAKFIMKPTGPYFFGYTLNPMIAAFIYGCFYYKKPLTVWRIFLAKGLVILIVNIFLGTLWLDLIYGKAFMAILPGRVVKNLIMWPIDTAVFYIIMKVLDQTGILKVFRSNIFKKRVKKDDGE